jgi:hypothetical protein
MLVSLIAFLTKQDARAFDYYQPDETGIKASAMGRAFVAVADDLSAAYWNPAGLAYRKRLEMGGAIKLIPYLAPSSFNLILPFDPLSIGLQYDERFFKRGETLVFNVLLGGGREIAPSLALGGNLSLVSQSYNKASADQAGYGFSLGVGALMGGSLIGMGEEWSFGSMLRSPDLIWWTSAKPSEKGSNSAFSVTAPPRWTVVGASFRPRGAAFRRGNEMTIAADLDLIPWVLTSPPGDHNPTGAGVSQPQAVEVRFHLGIEKIFEGIPVRGGLYTQQSVGAGSGNQVIVVPTLGTGFIDRNWQVGVSLENTSLISLQALPEGFIIKVYGSVGF